METGIVSEVMGAIVGGGIASIFWGFGIGFAKLRNGKNGQSKPHQYCDQHVELVKHVVEVRTDIKWLKDNFAEIHGLNHACKN